MIKIFTRLLLPLGLLTAPLLAQDVCESEEPFLLPPTSTFCADSNGLITIDFRIYNNGAPGSYRVRFPDGTDTLYTGVINTVNVVRTFPFACAAPPGDPIPPRSDALFYEYQGELTVTREDCVDEKGDNQRGTYDFRVVPHPIINIKTSDLTCIEEPFVVNFEGQVCSPELVETYQWFIDGQAIEGATQREFQGYEFPGPGAYLIRLEATTFKGCEEVYYFEKPINIRPAPKLDLQYDLDSTTLCDPQIMIFTDVTYEFATDFQWSSSSPDVSFSDPNAPNPVITIRNDSAGIRTIVVEASNEFCDGVQDSFRITTQRGQTIEVLEDILTCTGYELDLCGSLRYLPTPENIVWTADRPGVTFDDSTATCPYITFDDVGRYTLNARGNDVCGEVFDIPIKVRVRDGTRLMVDISAVDTLCTIDSTINLFNYVDRPGNVSLITGPGVADGVFDPSLVEGDVRVVVLDSCGAVYPMDFHVVPQEYYTGIDPTICMGETVDLFALQPGSYTGTGVTDNVFRTEGLTTGSYRIAFSSLTYCGGEDTLTIRVQEYPVASFTIPTDSCVGEGGAGAGTIYAGQEPVLVENSSRARTVYFKVLETGQEARDRDRAQFSFPRAGLYTLQQVVRFPGGVCTDTTERVIEVQFPPQMDYSFAMDSTTCDSLFIDFSLGTHDSTVSYAWEFSNTELSTEAKPSLSVRRPLVPSTLGVRAALENACYTTRDTFAVVLPQRFQVGFDILNDNNTVCSDDTVFLANTSVNAERFRVTFPDGSTATELPRQLILRNTSDRVMKYPIRLEGFNSSCPDEEMTDTIYVLPIYTEAAFGLDYANVCSAADVTLTNASTPGARVFVDWGDGSSPQSIDDLEAVQHVYAVERDTTFLITMTAQQCGLDSFTHSITVRPTPDPSFEAIATEANCIDKDIEFRSTAAIAPYGVVWDFGDGSPASKEHNPRHRYAKTGSYRVYCDAVSSNGCVARDSFDIDIGEYDGEAMAFTVPPTVCTNADFELAITAPLSGWTIDYGNGRIANEPMAKPYYEEGDFVMRLTATAPNGCTVDSLMPVRVYPGFEVGITTASGDTTVELGDELELSARISPPRNILDVVWRGDSIADPFSPLTSALPSNDGHYSIRLVDEHGCVATDSLRVNVEKDYADRIFAPNIFSPNGDGFNETFNLEVKANTVERIRNLRIYSRQGGLVYECTNCKPGTVGRGWDGTLGGKTLDPSVFVWTAEVDFVDGTTQSFSGDVALVR